MRNNFITSRQHGFHTGYSCETQLIWFWTNIIYLDLQKVFNKVPHARLLELHEIGGKLLLQQIENFLSNSYGRQCVHSCELKSDCVFSGVPQGSIWVHFIILSHVVSCK